MWIYLSIQIDEQINDMKAMEQVTFGSIHTDYAYNAFMSLIFKKSFLESFEDPMVRLIKYHFVLYSRGIFNGYLPTTSLLPFQKSTNRTYPETSILIAGG